MSLNDKAGLAMAQANAMQQAKAQARAQITAERQHLTKRSELLARRMELVQEQRDARKEMVNTMSKYLTPGGQMTERRQCEIDDMPWPQQMLTAFINHSKDIHYADSKLYQLTLDEMNQELSDITTRLKILTDAESQLDSSLLVPQFNPLAN